MATNTSYLGLTKPAQSDLYNVDVFNDNADKVDTNAQKTAANLATIEAVATASKPYAVGEYLVLNGILYKVTQAILNGGALVVGTNIAQDSVGTELKSLKDALSTVEEGTPTFGNSWQNNGFKVYKVGKICMLQLAVRRGTSLSNAVTLPQGFRPPINMSFNIQDIATHTMGYAYITASTGDISFHDITLSSGASNVLGNVVYPI